MIKREFHYIPPMQKKTDHSITLLKLIAVKSHSKED